MSDSTGHVVQFHISADLYERTLKVINMLEQSNDPMSHRETLGEIVVELTKTGLEYFFVKPLETAKLSVITQTSSSLGIAGLRKVMDPMIRKTIGGMNNNQLLAVCNFIRQIMNNVKK